MLSVTTTTKPVMILSLHPKFALLALAVLAALLVLDFEEPTAFVRRLFIENGVTSRKRQSQAATANDDTAQQHPDGLFNNLPVFYKEFDKRFHSNAHCVGENFVESNEGNEAAKHRHCKFQNLCFDMAEREFVLFLSKEQRALHNALIKAGESDFWPASSLSENMAVWVGGVHPRWRNLDRVLKWYPKFRNVKDTLRVKGGGGRNASYGGYYMLPPEYAFVPWNSYHGYNPGHIITDDFLPIYTLLSYFNLTDKELAMVHIDLPDNDRKDRWDNCQNHLELCEPYMEKFLPLLGTEPRRTSTQHTATLASVEVRSRYVCAAHGVAGMGMLTDHGKKLHGNFQKDFLWTHNGGRGDSFYRFRNWMAGRLLGSNVEKARMSRPPYRIVLSSNSSTNPQRNVSFERHAATLRSKLGKKYDLDVRQVVLSEMSMPDQVRLAAEASVLVTAAGGGASVAHFLPRGASLLLYFVEFPPEKEVDGDYNGWVMDWDTYNNFAYVRSHWLPIRHANATYGPDDDQRAADMNVFVKLVDQELDLISHLDDYD